MSDRARSIRASLCGALALALLATASSAQTAAEYAVHLNFGGLIALVPKPAERTKKPVRTSKAPLAEFWILAPRGEERAELVAAAGRARNGGALPTRPPNKLHHAFLRVSARDLLRGGCIDTQAACEAAVASIPDARVQLALGAEDPFHPDPGRRARYDIVLEAARETGSGVTVDGLDGVDGLTAPAGAYAEACKGCAAFADGTPVRYAPPESGVPGFGVPLGFRIGFRDGERVDVKDDTTVVALDRVTGVTRIHLNSRDTATLRHTIALKPAAGSPLEIDIVNVPPEEMMDAPPDRQELTRLEAVRLCLSPPRLTHQRLLYLLAPRPSAQYAYDYTHYDAPIDPRQVRWCDALKSQTGGHMLHIDPFCTKPGQLLSRD